MPDDLWSSHIPESRSCLCFLDRRKNPAIAAITSNPNIETPTPIPILAPWLSPPDFDAAGGAGDAFWDSLDVEVGVGVGVGVEDVGLGVVFVSGVGGEGPDLSNRFRRLNLS